MITSPTRNNLRDFSQRHLNTYGWYISPATGNKTLVMISNVNTPLVHFTDVYGGSYYAKVDADVKFEFLPITRGWYALKNGEAYMLQRIPARQYQRGISSGNTAVYRLTASGNTDKKTVSIDILHEIFVDKTKQTYENFIKGMYTTFVLNKYFVIHALSKKVFMYDRYIGTYSSEGTITLHSPLFAQELQDCCNRNNYPFVVKS